MMANYFALPYHNGFGTAVEDICRGGTCPVASAVWLWQSLNPLQYASPWPNIARRLFSGWPS